MTKTTIKQCAAALRKHGGIITHAAQELGLERTSLAQRVARNPILQRVVTEAREEISDYAESNVIKGIKAAKVGDTTDSKWWLVQMAKSRGYGKLAVDDDQLAAMIAGADPAALKKLAEGG